MFFFLFREKGLQEVCDLLFETLVARIEVEKTEQEAKIRQLEAEKTQKEARIDQLELEKTELMTNMLEKIPECPVNITLSDKFLNV